MVSCKGKIEVRVNWLLGNGGEFKNGEKRRVSERMGTDGYLLQMTGQEGIGRIWCRDCFVHMKHKMFLNGSIHNIDVEC